jgi:hypothetical protein
MVSMISLTLGDIFESLREKLLERVADDEPWTAEDEAAVAERMPIWRITGPNGSASVPEVASRFMDRPSFGTLS